MTRKLYNWSTVDWSKNTDDIAAEMGVDRSQVSRARRREAPKTVGKFTEKRGRRKAKVDWSKVDWSKNNTELGNEYGLDRMTVYRYRKIHAPDTAHGHGRPRRGSCE